MQRHGTGKIQGDLKDINNSFSEKVSADFCDKAPVEADFGEKASVEAEVSDKATVEAEVSDKALMKLESTAIQCQDFPDYE